MPQTTGPVSPLPSDETPSPAGVRRGASVLFKLALLVSGLVVPTAVALSVVAYTSARDLLRQRIQSRLELVATDRAAMVTSYVAHQRELIHLVTSRTRLRDLLSRRAELPENDFERNAKRILVDALEGSARIAELFVADPQGKVLAATNSAWLGRDVSQRPEFLAGKHDAFLGQPYEHGEGVRAYLSAPIAADGQLLAVAIAVIDISPLARMLSSEVGLGKTGEVLLAHRSDSEAQYLFAPAGHRLTTASLRDVPPMSAALSGQEGFMIGPYSGHEVLAVYVPVATASGDRAAWGLVAKMDVEEVDAPLWSFRRRFFTIQALLVFLGLVVAYVAAYRLLRPIGQLTHQAAAAAAGDLSVRVPVSSRDELGALAEAFNGMVERLAENQVSLEERVTERTGELAKANAVLADEVFVRRSMEDALKASERRTRSILEAAHEAFIAIDDQSIVTDWNRQAELTFGWSRTEAIGRAMPELIIPPRARQAHRQGLDHFRRTGEHPLLNRRLELTAVHRDGHEFPVEATISALRSGPDLMFGAFLRNISQSKQAERLLRESEDRFRLLVDSVQDYAIFRLDPTGHVLSWNPGAQRIQGYTAEEIIGEHYCKFYAPADVATDKPARALLAAAATGHFDDEGVRIRKGGTQFWANVALTALYDDAGELLGYAEITRDITERKQAQDALHRAADELAHSNAELERFAYVASHDLQEPLRAVVGYCQLLARRYRGRLDSEADEFIGFAVDGATRMQALINDLLAYSRVATRARGFELTDLNTAFQQAIANLQMAIDECGAQITCDELPTLPADRMQMAQVWQNLLGNAIKFRGPQAPRIHCQATPLEEEWQFVVRDNGLGIDPAYTKRIFVLFQRLHTRREYAGTGIGLALCERIVERHGGRIWVESQPGQGSAFFFTLPKTQQPLGDEAFDDLQRGPTGAPD